MARSAAAARSAASARSAVSVRNKVGNVPIHNQNFELTPPFTAATNTSTRWINGTAGGHVTDSTWGWALHNLTGSPTAKFDSTTKYAGSYALNMNGTATGDRAKVSNSPDNVATSPIGALNRGRLIKVSPETSYTWSFYYKTDITSLGGSGGFWSEYMFYASDFTIIGSTAAALVTNTTVDWTLGTVSITTPATAAYLRFDFTIHNYNGDLWIDNVKVEEIGAIRTAIS